MSGVELYEHTYFQYAPSCSKLVTMCLPAVGAFKGPYTNPDSPDAPDVQVSRVLQSNRQPHHTEQCVETGPLSTLYVQACIVLRFEYAVLNFTRVSVMLCLL